MPTTPTTVQALVYELFNAALVAAAPAAVINFPGLDFLVPADRSYLKVQLLPNTPFRLTIDSDGPMQYQGIYQITVVREQSVGIMGAQEAAGLVALMFPADTKLKSGELVVRVMADPAVAMSMPDGADLLTPVSVEYETFF